MAIGGKYQLRATTAMAVLRDFYDPGAGVWLTTGWWNSANALKTTIDFCARTGSRTYADVLETTFAKAGGARFLNDFYDDEGWWALAWIKAYDLTGDARYLAAAQTIFSDMCGGWDATCGGGIWWNKSHAKKNAIANELFLSVAARLHLRQSGDGGPGSCLDWAERTWSWFANSGLIDANDSVNDGLTAACLNDGGVTWTYNQGVVLGGLMALHAATGDDTLVVRARAIADAAIRRLADARGILKETNEPDLGADGPQFKGIFLRNLSELQQLTGEPRYRAFILANAAAIWTLNRTESCRLGGCWAGPFDVADAARQSAAIDALNAALLFDVEGSAYQAEDGVLHGLAPEAIYRGYNGTGYLAGWNRDGQGVDLTVSVASAGAYDLVLRYAAVGDAARCLSLNGAVLTSNQAFPKTGNWSVWTIVSVYDVPLLAGRNVVSVRFDASKGSRNWLNLDQIAVL